MKIMLKEFVHVLKKVMCDFSEICCRLKKEATESTATNSVTPLDPLFDSLEGSNERQTALSTESDTEIDVVEIG
jgi:hypothetical protein